MADKPRHGAMSDGRRPNARRRAAIAGALATAGGLIALPAAAASSGPEPLAPPDTQGRLALEQVLARRRSIRRFAARPLALAAVSQLLWAAQGVTSPQGWRTTPSAGALYPLELHLVATRVEGLDAGVYRYRPATHALQRTPSQASASALQQAAIGQAALGSAAAVVLIAAVEARSIGKYAARAGRYVAIEAGAAAQNLALQAVALGLGSVVVGAFDDAAMAEALRLPAGEQPIVLLPIGWPG